MDQETVTELPDAGLRQRAFDAITMVLPRCA